MSGMIVKIAVAAAMTMLSVASAQALEMSFEWGPTKKCFDTKSPPIRLGGVPAGTEKLRFRMVDLDAPTYPHGGGTVSYKGDNALPYGAFRYTGPCPPSPHTYRISVDALDAKGKKLGSSAAKKRFP